MYNMITKIINPRIRGENEMNEKTTKKISLSKFFLILALIVIIVMVFFMYKIYNDKNLVVETKNISNESFLTALEQMENLFKKASSDEEKLTIEKVILANYEELVLKN